MAGFLDGEGYIGMHKRKRKDWNYEYHISMTIGQKDGKTLDWIKDNFGGFIHKVKRDETYMWLVSNKEAYNILKQLTPYLKYKKPQALVALDFYENRDLRRPIPTEELQRRENCLLELKRLKRVVIKSNYCK